MLKKLLKKYRKYLLKKIIREIKNISDEGYYYLRPTQAVLLIKRISKIK